MTYRFSRANAHPALLTFEQLQAAWHDEDETPLAECVYDPELHVGPYDTIESAEQRTAREDVARDICTSCPALLRCTLYAMKARPKSGIWAGWTPAEITAYAVELDEQEVA